MVRGQGGMRPEDGCVCVGGGLMMGMAVSRGRVVRGAGRAGRLGAARGALQRAADAVGAAFDVV